MLKGYGIRLNEFLDDELYKRIEELRLACFEYDGTNFKFELDFKLAGAIIKEVSPIRNIDEFTYWYDDKLIGYMGINDFGGRSLEVNGMVHPDYRKMGIFNRLFSLVLDEWGKRKTTEMLLLTDKSSQSGRGFIKSTGALYNHTEFEMVLDNRKYKNIKTRINLKIASNNDAQEIARQNAIYFNEDNSSEDLLDVEEERKRGFHIFLAEYSGNVIGKVHLHISNKEGGIFGLGILPEYRSMGLGRELLNGSVEKLIDLGADNIFLQVDGENETALGLYTSCGFQVKYAMEYYKLKREKT